jgi:hypothetical protein
MDSVWEACNNLGHVETGIEHDKRWDEPGEVGCFIVYYDRLIADE